LFRLSATKTLSYGIAADTQTIQGKKITLFNENAFKRTETIHGPSPYTEKYEEGYSLRQETEPLQLSGELDKSFNYVDVTPHIGREYPTAQLSNVLKDEKQLRDLAITISRRGVVFFRN
jgi:hypothetical protein